MPNPSETPPVSSKAQNQDFKDMDVLCNFKINIESQSLKHEYTKYQLPYLHQDQDAKSQSGESSIIQSLKSELEENGCSLNY